MFFTLPEKIGKYIDQFTGRAWLLPEILKWCENSTERLLLITGDPGTGKSMVTAWLAGSGPLPDDPAPGITLPDNLLFNGLLPRQQLDRLRSQVKAVHFCQADGGSVKPDNMAQNLADQLTGNLQGFDKEIKAILSDRIVLAPVLNVGTVEAGGRVTGITIQEINLNDFDDRMRFNRSVREPLTNLYKHSNAGPILIMIDSLDEALTYSGGVKIPDLLATLSDLPNQVRFLATTRPDPRVLKSLFQVPMLDLVENAPSDAEDVRRYAFARIPVAIGEPRRSNLAKQVGDASKGIFLYGRLVVEDLLNDLKSRSLPEDVTFPLGLPGYYNRFLERELGKNLDLYRESYCPVLGVVSVAQGKGLSGTQVEKVTRQNVEKIILACLQFMDGDYPEGPFRVFHRSFADFLLESKENTFYHIDASKMHALISDYYYSLQDGMPPLGKWDEYALLYISVHLEGASRLQDEEARHYQVKRLVQLVQDPMFQKRFRRKVNDEAQMKHIILSAVRAAAADTFEEALELLIRAVRLSQTHRHDRLQPGPVFEMAETGNLGKAVDQLAAFPMEPQWLRAASLVLAWLAAKNEPNKAAEVLKNMESQEQRSSPEVKLAERLRAVLEGGAPVLDPLPTAQSHDFMDLLLLRLGGQSVGEELIGNITSGYDLHPNPQIGAVLGELVEPGSGDSVPVFLAQQDGPFLVAYGLADQLPDHQEGLEFFKQYLELHAGNPYLYYRNATLWLLMDSVLRHPDSTWTLQALKTLFTTAFNTEGMGYEEALELAVLALQAHAGKAEALQVLDGRCTAALERATKLKDARYQSDTWGVHKRRLCALAQAYLLLPDRQDTVKELIGEADKLPRGFAGFMYHAWLNQAEAVRICGLEDSFTIASALQNALTSAHNVQDSVFCARSTAQVNAMMRRWWPLPQKPDLEDLINKFSKQPDAVEFTTLHIIGEGFQHREKGPDKLALQEGLLQGKTLASLSEAFRLPLADFVAANAEQGWETHTILPDGALVNVPDPEFAPLLSARLAAEVVAADWLLPNEKRAMIQSLTLPAVHDRTSMDTILARLMVAAIPSDLSLLERLLPLARQVYAQYPDTSSGQGLIEGIMTT